ncbi:MAG: prepilin-type N-terminal cleavage/methylation domain-containing protein [Saccharofermentanales bacterium]
MKIKNNKRRKGFTLIELIVVIAILAILAAVAVPNFIGMTNKAQTATEVAAAAEYVNAINIYNTLNSNAKIAAIPATATALNLTLGELMPVTEFTDADCLKYVLARISFTEAVAATATTAAIPGGIAQVENKDDIV